MPLSPRDSATLYAISRLPIGDDGWRRAAYRDELHTLAGLSRGAVARAFKGGALAGLVVVQGVGPSARLPEGYKLTTQGESLARGAGPIQPDPVRGASPDPVFGSGVSLVSSRDTENKDPNPERTDPARSSSADPVAANQPFAFDQRTLAVFYAAMTQTPLCGCMLPMHAKERHNKGGWFWACMHGRKGCGLTAPMRYQPKQQPQRESGERRARDQSTLTLDDILKRKAEAKQPPTTKPEAKGGASYNPRCKDPDAVLVQAASNRDPLAHARNGAPP